MTTITISKNEYLKIIKTQEKLEEKLDLLQKMFKEEIQDEIRPEYVKKLDRIDAEIDKGKGVKFSSISEMKKYLRSL
ncbi:MAG: hypothetical protein AAB926_01225 [Patescibacteria group bacterium]